MVVAVKSGKDIGGLDSIFSATVGNNVLVKMATFNEKNGTNKKSPLNKQSSRAKLKEIAPDSADMLAKRLDSTSGGPISECCQSFFKF